MILIRIQALQEFLVLQQRTLIHIQPILSILHQQHRLMDRHLTRWIQTERRGRIEIQTGRQLRQILYIVLLQQLIRIQGRTGTPALFRLFIIVAR